MKKMYTTNEYIEKNPTYGVEDSPWKASQIIKIIKNNKLQPRSICEVGCGAGEILNQLYLQMPNNVSFSGYEISSQAFKLCQQREKDRIHFYLEDLLKNEKVFFDLVLAIDVFEHVEDYLGFLEKLRKKGSYKIFHIPLDLSVQAVLRSSPILKARSSVGHIHYFTKETAIATLIDAGYEILDCFFTKGATDLPSKSVRSWLAKLPRKMMYKLNKDMAARVLGGYSLMVLTK
ncbi:class I SAM-dependent methyltransferase [Thermodesulfovibrionales bacterium]|nr:class I SAM-dependent methyltransferase [Thermodesulfovibrionales bacterium]